MKIITKVLGSVRTDFPKLGLYKDLGTEETVELEKVYLNNLGAWCGVRRSEGCYETFILDSSFWSKFEESK